MGKEHVSVSRVCTINVRSMTLIQSRVHYTEVCLAIYRESARGHLAVSCPMVTAQMRPTTLSDLPTFQLSSDGLLWSNINFHCRFEYSHNFRSPSSDPPKSHIFSIVLQRVKEGKRKTVGTCCIDLSAVLQKPIAEEMPILMVSSSKNILTEKEQKSAERNREIIGFVLASVSTIMNFSRLPTPEIWYSTAVATSRTGQPLTPYLPVPRHFDQSPATAASQANPRVATAPPLSECQGTIDRTSMPFHAHQGTISVGHARGLSIGSSDSSVMAKSRAIVLTASQFTSRLASMEVEQLQQLTLWSADDTPQRFFNESIVFQGATLPVLLQTAAVATAYPGVIVLFSAADSMDALLLAHFSALEERADEDNICHVAIVGSDVLLCKVFSYTGLQVPHHPIINRVVFFPVRTPHLTQTNCELLNFFALLSSGSNIENFLKPQNDATTTLSLLAQFQRGATQCLQYPIGVAYATGADGKMLEALPFAKSAYLESLDGMSVSYFPATVEDPGLTRNEVKKDPVQVAILRIPTVSLPFTSTPALPLRVWSSRSIERGLSLESRSLIPTVLQSSLYGKCVSKLVASVRSTAQSIHLRLDESDITIPIKSISVVDAAYIVRVAAM